MPTRKPFESNSNGVEVEHSIKITNNDRDMMDSVDKALLVSWQWAQA